MAHDVFISYATRDKHEADAICAGLEQRKIRCWIAPRDITASSPYGNEIVQAIEGCRVCVVVVSAGANESRYVMREVELAVHYARPIVPFKVESVPLAGNLKFFLNSIHWLDAITPPVEQHIELLGRVVERLLAGQEWEKERGVQPPEERGKSALWGLVGSLAFLVALPIVAGLVFRLAPFWPSRMGVVLFTVLVNAVVAAWVFVGWRSEALVKLRPRLAAISTAAGVFLLFYLILTAAFVWDAPTPDEPDVGGFLLRPPIAKLLAEDPAETVQHLFDGFENRPFAIWVPWTVVVTRVALVATWLGCFGCLSAVTTILALWVATKATRPPAT